MRTIDRVLAAVGLLTFAAFLGIIAFYVPQPMLLLVFFIGLALTAYDFARDLLAKR